MTSSNLAFFNQLYEGTYKKTVAYVAKMCDDISQIHDIMQDIYTEVYLTIQSKGENYLKKPDAFVMQIAKCKVKQYYRNSRKIKTIPLIYEDEDGGKFSMKKRSFIMIAAVCAVLTMGVFAATYLLSAGQVAEEFEVGAFDENDAVELYEVQTDAGYKVSFLGLAYGEELKNYAEMNISEQNTYAVVAVENEDGTPIDPTFAVCVTPLVKGLNPGLYHTARFGSAGYSASVVDGVYYQLKEVENIEYFAEEGVYLGVTFDFPNIEKYHMDENTGEITANEKYEDLNILFDLPIDISKADQEKVDKFMNENT